MSPVQSRLMGADEEGTLARLRAHRRGELIDPKIAEHRGRIVKTTGDGMLVRVRQRCRARYVVRPSCRRIWPSAMPLRQRVDRIDFSDRYSPGRCGGRGGDIFWGWRKTSQLGLKR